MRSLKLNLKHLFLLVALFAAIFALAGHRLRYFQNQHELIDGLRVNTTSLDAIFKQSPDWLDWPLRLIAPSDQLSNCVSLSVGFDSNTKISRPNIAEVLDRISQLGHLNFLYISESPAMSPLEEKHLLNAIKDQKDFGSVLLGTKIISKDGFDQLIANGINVDHWGLSDHRLDKNYIFTEDNYLQIDFSKSRFGLFYDSSNRLWCNFYIVNSGDRYDSLNYYLTNLDATVPVPHEISNVAYFRTNAKHIDDTDANFCDGLHQRPRDFRINIVGKTETTLHLRFDFACPYIAPDYEDLRNGKRAEIDIEIPYNPGSIETKKDSDETRFPVYERLKSNQ